MYEAALPIFKESGDDHAVATILGNLAGILFDEGDLAKGADLYEQARLLFERAGAQSSLAFVLYQLGDLHLGKGDLAASRKHHEQALAIRKQLGEKGGAAESQLALARLALQQSLPGPAEALAREAADEFRKEKRTDDEAMAQSILARALLGQGRVPEARETARAARERGQASGNQATRLAVQTTAALVQAALGDTQTAAHTLRDVIAEARRGGLPSLEFEARLALGQVEITADKPAAGRARLAALEKEAAAKGYAGIAHRAAEAAQPQK
jgi:tetratricopeptide (TPR) repeat protein